jgi:hypothetical protein
VLNGDTYTATKELTFGKNGTMGYEETLVIDFYEGVNAVVDGQKTASFIA